jgi:pimeloyl-ACP methyl ester carboxylesterase
MPAPIVMVHGAFCGGWTFEGFRGPFEAAGHTVLAPDLRGHGPNDASYAVTGLSMTDYARDIAAICKAQAEPPILLGHSMGGLVAMMAAAKAPVAALVLLAPSPPWGVASSSVEEALAAWGLHLLGPYWAMPVNPDPTLMRAYGLDRLPAGDREAAMARLRPESGRAVFETLNWWLDPFMTTSVATLSVPSLAIAGARDVVHPVATVRLTADRIGARFEVMPGMSHWLPGETGYGTVAQTVLAWLASEVGVAA